MKVIAADFVLYPVKDMAVAQKFYRDTLGLTVYNESDGWSKCLRQQSYCDSCQCDVRQRVGDE